MSVLHYYGTKLPQKFNVDNVFQTFFADFNKKVLIVPVFVWSGGAYKNSRRLESRRSIHCYTR